MKTLKCVCIQCSMRYEITYNDQDFIDPEFCAGCGVDEEYLLKEVVETEGKE
jgi:hypothetical protein